MSYNVYTIKRTDTPISTDLGIVSNEIIFFADQETVYSSNLVDSIFGKAGISPYGTERDSSPWARSVALPNWLEILFGITFQSKLDKAYKQLNKTIDQLNDKQLKMARERGEINEIFPEEPWTEAPKGAPL